MNCEWIDWHCTEEDEGGRTRKGTGQGNGFKRIQDKIVLFRMISNKLCSNNRREDYHSKSPGPIDIAARRCDLKLRVYVINNGLERSRFPCDFAWKTWFKITCIFITWLCSIYDNPVPEPMFGRCIVSSTIWQLGKLSYLRLILQRTETVFVFIQGKHKFILSISSIFIRIN
jgi:hypothetical protein